VVPDNDALDELNVRLFHQVIPHLGEGPILTAYVERLRAMRERVHPIGVAEYRIIQTAAGHRFRLNLGDRLGADFYYGHDPQARETRLFTALVGEGDVVVDVGANFGYYTVLAAAAAGPGGVVHAFEPDPQALDLLRENIALNKLESVHVHGACLGGEDAERDFYLMEEPAFSGLSPTGRARPRGQIRTRVRTLDGLLAGYGDAPVTRMKIDVEGHEHEVLAGARATIARSRDAIVVMIEVSAKNLTPERRGRLDAQLRELEAAHGLRGWVLRSDQRGGVRLDNTNEIADLHSANVFLVRAGSPAQSRLEDAVRRLDPATERQERARVLDHLLDRQAAAVRLRAKQEDVIRDHQARIARLAAELEAARGELEAARGELEAARGELHALGRRVECRVGARLRQLGRTRVG
jgi:FkbM family methyltransferase